MIKAIRTMQQGHLGHVTAHHVLRRTAYQRTSLYVFVLLAIELDPEIVMKSGRIMLLDDEAAAVRRIDLDLSAWLASA